MSSVEVDVIAQQVKSFVLEKFPLARKQNLQNSADLINSGIVDSLGILDLVAFLENEFELHISDEELLPENFQTIECIAALVRTKKR
jgi:acyl carrier protein